MKTQDDAAARGARFCTEPRDRALSGVLAGLTPVKFQTGDFVFREANLFRHITLGTSLISPVYMLSG